MNADHIKLDLHTPPVTTGALSFAADVRELAQQSASTRQFIRRAGERYAFIHFRDWKTPSRFLRQLSGKPPVRFGTNGFRPALVDDRDPARHYTAFVVVGFWLPHPLALLTLWAWEVLGFVRYRGMWSQPDMRLGSIGLRHGGVVRREGAGVLAGLIERELVEKKATATTG